MGLICVHIEHEIQPWTPFVPAQDKTLKGSLPQEQSPWVPTPGEQITWATYPNGLLPENHRLNKSADLNRGYVIVSYWITNLCSHLVFIWSVWSVCFFHRFWQGLFTLESNQPTKSASCIPIDEASFVNLSQFCQPNVLDEVFCYRRWRKWNEQPLPAWSSFWSAAPVACWVGPCGFSIKMRKV